MKLSVIIVSYNVRHYLEQCVRSVLSSVPSGISTEIFIVDNASQDGTIGYLRQRFTRTSGSTTIRIIANARNIGFGRANNQAIRKATGEYILFLNPDTLVTEQTLTDCLTFADTHPNMGGLGVKMLRDNGGFALESRRGHPTPWTAFCKMTGLAALFPRSRRFGRYYLRYLDENRESEIDIISGAFMLVRKTALDKSGMFDEDFFMYGEDIDLSYRLRLAGYRNYYLPVPILHYKGESTQKSSYKYVHIFYEAMLIFFRKHYRHYGVFFTFPIKTAILVRGIIALIGQQIKNVKSFITPYRRNREDRYLYLGTHSDAIRELAAQWSLNIDIIETTARQTPEGHLASGISTAPYAYIVYDVCDFSRSDILNLFSRSDHRKFIGTFDPQTHVLITGADTFSFNPVKNEQQLD